MRLYKKNIAAVSQSSRYAYFNFSDKIETDQPQIVLAGYERTLSNYRIERDDFPFWGLEFVVGGSGRLWLDGQAHTLGPGTAFCYGPNTRHIIESDNKIPLEKYFIDLHGAAAEARLQASKWIEQNFRSSIPSTRICSLIDGIIQDEIDQVATASILEHSLQLILELSVPRPLSKHAQSGNAYATYLRVREYFDTHYSQQGRVKDFSKKTHIDSAYLSRLFTKFGKETPYRYLNRLRMNRAMHLLLHHNLQIQEIADSVGYSDAFHFSTRFKQYYGHSPKAFKRQM